MDLRHFEHDFRESVLHQAIKWVKTQQVRKLLHEYSVGEFRVKIKTNAHQLIHASCSCHKLNCAHLAAVLLFRQGHVYDFQNVTSKKSHLFDKQILFYKRELSHGRLINKPNRSDLVSQLAWLCVHFENENYIHEVSTLWHTLSNKRFSTHNQEIWHEVALYSLKRSALLSDLVSIVFPICVKNIKHERMLDNLAERLRILNRRRHDQLKAFLLEVIIQQRLRLTGKLVIPSNANAAIAWCKLHGSHAKLKVMQQCQAWLMLPMEGRVQFAQYCRENFSEHKEVVLQTYYAELVAAPIIRKELWDAWYNGISNAEKVFQVNTYLSELEPQPYLVRLAKRLFVLVQQKRWEELARELRKPEITFSMAHEALTSEAMQQTEVYKVYEKLANQAILWSSGALKKLIQQKAAARLNPKYTSGAHSEHRHSCV